MPYVPGGRNIKPTIIKPNVIPASNNYSGVYIEFGSLLIDSKFREILDSVNGTRGLAEALVLRLIEKDDIEHRLQYPEGRIYGNRVVFGLPVVNWDGTIRMRFLETRNPSIRDLFIAWASLISNYYTGAALSYQLPRLQARIFVYDFSPDLNSIINKITLFNCYPQGIPEVVTLDVTAQELLAIDITFAYSAFIVEDNPTWDRYAEIVREKIKPTINFNEVTVI